MEGLIVLLIAFIAGVIVAAVFFTLTLQRTLNSCSQENRKMEGGMVWLSWIPLFGLGWMIYVVIKISESLKLEFESRGIHSDDPQFAYGIGLGYAICACAQILISPVGIATLILWIIYWVKMNNYYKILNQSNQLKS